MADFHTKNFYFFSEVVSALQKCIRRGEKELAIFWALELEKSELGAILYSRLWTIVAEDIGLAAPFLAVDLLPIYEEWKACTKGKPSKALECTIAFVSILADAPKSRKVDNIYLYSKFKVEPTKLWEKGSLSTKVQQQIYALFHQDLFDLQANKHKDLESLINRVFECIENGNYEDACFFVEQLLLEPLCHCLSVEQVLSMHQLKVWRIHRDSKQGNLHYLWYILLNRQRKNSELLPAFKVLFNLSVSKVGHPLLYLLFAIGIKCYEEELPSYKIDQKALMNFVKYYKQPEGRTYAIPQYALDKHCKRGRTYAKAQHNINELHEAAQKKGVASQLWSAEEIAKSHGAYLKYEMKKGYSPLSYFFRVGAYLETESKASICMDPYAEKIANLFWQLEKKYGVEKANGQFIFEKMYTIWQSKKQYWLDS